MSKPRQEEIPGTASQERNPELHALALELKDIQDESMENRKKDKAKRDEIMGLMKKLDIKEYEVDGVELWLESDTKTKVKVRVKEGGGDGDE